MYIGPVDCPEVYEIPAMIDDPDLSPEKQEQLRRIFAAVLPRMAEVAVTPLEKYITSSLLAGKSYDDLMADYRRPGSSATVSGLGPDQVAEALEALDLRVAWNRYLEMVNVPVAA